jgi:hypothetical protein
MGREGVTDGNAAVQDGAKPPGSASSALAGPLRDKRRGLRIHGAVCVIAYGCAHASAGPRVCLACGETGRVAWEGPKRIGSAQA